MKDMAGLIERSISVSIALPHILPILIAEFLKLNPNVHINRIWLHPLG
ncbi:hypothetical protein [Peribacillus sp. TH24]|nr:hypothetical protein [Peribacillus sp. TH24]MBK5444434.1 hypothetical protein [Peribacillus sp. TH24]